LLNAKPDTAMIKNLPKIPFRLKLKNRCPTKETFRATIKAIRLAKNNASLI
jgi:hypothetical protein